jgi:biuret amidohydrolase
MTTALLLLDLQHALCAPDGIIGGPSGLAQQVARRNVLGNAQRALACARSKGDVVFHVALAFGPGYVNRTNRSDRFAKYETQGKMRIGEVDSAICPEVAPAEGEFVFYKGSVSPFASTGLLATLHSLGIGRLVLAGVATNLVVESTAREAVDRGFAVEVLEDACASFSVEMHEFARANTLPIFSKLTAVDEYCSGQ